MSCVATWTGKTIEFLAFMNTFYRNIKCIMELEENGKLPVLDILLYRKQDGTVDHGIYPKPTHMDLYLNAKSLHYLAQKESSIININLAH